MTNPVSPNTDRKVTLYQGELAPCEMGDEDGCGDPARFVLDAPGSYVIPLLMCPAHADEEAFYYGTLIPSGRSPVRDLNEDWSPYEEAEGAYRCQDPEIAAYLAGENVFSQHERLRLEEATARTRGFKDEEPF